MEAQLAATAFVRRAIGRVIIADGSASRETGTAFAVSAALALTAFHCVRGRSASEATTAAISLLLGEEVSLPARVLGFDVDADLALLELKNPLPAGWLPITLMLGGELLRDAHFQAPGFPGDRAFRASAVTADGEILEPAGDMKGVPAIELFSRQVAPGRDIHGFSGAPVLVRATGSSRSHAPSRWAAVGVIRWAQPIPETERIGLGGAVYACPLTVAAGAWPALEDLVDRDMIPAQSEEAARRQSMRRYLLDFDDQLREGVHVVGREALLTRIQRFDQTHLCGYVHVQASAGLGKTALAARFATLEQAPAFFADASLGTTRADQCLNHLAAMLIARYGDDGDELDEYSGRDAAVLIRLLRQASAQSDGPLWIVVDALDEADRGRPGANPLLLPPRLPRGVFFLVTSREPAEELHVAGETGVDAIELSGDEDWQREDLARYVRGRLEDDPALRGRVSAGGETDQLDTIAERLAEAAAGNFMYAVYVLGDLASGLAVEELPVRLAGYYEVRFWNVMTRAIEEQGWDQWDALYRPLLEVLAVAMEPVTAAWLAAQVGRPATEVSARVLTPWRRYLPSVRVDGEERWRILHRSFADFLASKLDLAGAHAALAARLREQPGEYGRRHLSSHLSAAVDITTLETLVKDAQWHAEQLAAAPAGRLVLHDLDEAWSAAEASDKERIAAGGSPEHLGVAAWCATATASVRGEIGAVPPALLGMLVEDELWTLERACETARNAPEPDRRALGLLELSRFEPGLLEDALEAARQITRTSRAAEITAEIAESLPQPQRRDVLVAQLERAEEASKRDDAYAPAALEAAYVVEALVPHLPADLLPRVLALARATEPRPEREALLIALAERAGAQVAADPIARETLGRWMPVSALDALAAEPGSREAAERGAAALDDLDSRAWEDGTWSMQQRTVEWTIDTLASRLDATGLRRCAEQATLAGGFALDALQAIARGLAARACYEEALDCIDHLSSDVEARLLASWVSELPQPLRPRALEMANQIEDAYARGQALGSLARWLPRHARASTLSGALARELFNDKHDQARLLTEYARHLEPEQATAALELAVHLVPDSRAALIEALIPALPVDQLERALRAIGGIKERLADTPRAQLITRLGRATIISEAKRAAYAERGSWTRLALARGLDAEGRQEALRVARSLDPWAEDPTPEDPTRDLLLALSAAFSGDEAQVAASLLPLAERGLFRDLRALHSAAARDDVSGRDLARRAREMDAPLEIWMQIKDVLIEHGRAHDALGFAEFLDEDLRADAIVAIADASDQEVHCTAVQVAFGIRDFSPRMRALVSLARDMDRATLLTVCARLDEDAEAASQREDGEKREVMLQQLRAAQLSLQARLPRGDREPFVRELDTWLAVEDWETLAKLLFPVQCPNVLPADLAAVVQGAWSRLLHALSLQPRSTLLQHLGWLAPVVYGFAGDTGARDVAAAVSAACGRWP